jgi:hypothetical protein
MAVDTLGHLLALPVTPANEQDRAQVEQLTTQVQEVTGEAIEVALLTRATPEPNRPRLPRRPAFTWKW